MQMEAILEAKPEDVGYDSSRIAVLNHHLQKLVDNETIIGSSYCVAKKGKIIACDAVGYSHYRKLDGWKMKTDSIMSAASVTKLFTTVAIFQLVEDGLIRLDEPMGKYVPQMSIEPFKEITIANVLSHTSGLWPDIGCFPEEKDHLYWSAVESCKSGDDWVKAALKLGVRRRPNEEWMYSSFGYALLGVLIGNVTGEFANDYIMNHIVIPLGMTETAFFPNKQMFLKHIVRNEQVEKYKEQLEEAMKSGIPIEDEDSIWSEVPATAGGLHSNVIDLIKFAQMLCNGGRYHDVRILSRMSIEKMSEQHLSNMPSNCWGGHDKSRLYGLGPDLRRGDAIITSDKFFFHEGAGALCVAVDPKEELAATWLVPYTPKVSWSPECLLNVKNVIWSGTI